MIFINSIVPKKVYHDSNEVGGIYSKGELLWPPNKDEIYKFSSVNRFILSFSGTTGSKRGFFSEYNFRTTSNDYYKWINGNKDGTNLNFDWINDYWGGKINIKLLSGSVYNGTGGKFTLFYGLGLDSGSYFQSSSEQVNIQITFFPNTIDSLSKFYWAMKVPSIPDYNYKTVEVYSKKLDPNYKIFQYSRENNNSPYLLTMNIKTGKWTVENNY